MADNTSASTTSAASVGAAAPITDYSIINRILVSEGGYVNNPNDRGGPTNFGITASELGVVRNLGRAATADEVKALTQDQAMQIYLERYIVTPGFTAIEDMGLRLIVVDSAVLHGVSRATKWLQQALNVKITGVIDDATKAGLLANDSKLVAQKFLAIRITFFGALITADHSQAVFAAGWLHRVADLIQYS